MIPGGEERTDRAIREPAGEDFTQRGASFAFDVSTGELSGGSESFAVITGAPEEVSAWTLMPGTAGSQTDSRAVLDENSTGSLIYNFPCFSTDSSPPQLKFVGHFHYVHLSPSVNSFQTGATSSASCPIES